MTVKLSFVQKRSQQKRIAGRIEHSTSNSERRLAEAAVASVFDVVSEVLPKPQRSEWPRQAGDFAACPEFQRAADWNSPRSREVAQPGCVLQLARDGLLAALISFGIAGWSASAVGVLASGFEATRRHTLGRVELEADFESVFARDILLTQGTLGYGQVWAGTEWKLSYAHNTFELDYRPAPFDFLGYDAGLSESRNALQASFRQRIHNRLTLLGAGGFYDGFTDYRSIWLNEYYRQQFSALPAYVEAEPNGANVSAGLRWTYLTASGILQADVGFLKDEIAPGYEIDFDGLRRGRPNLYTSTFHFSTENILTRRIRLLNDFRMTDTTNRQKRYGYQSSLNVAAGESWVVRAYGGYTREDPTLQAYYFGSTVEYELTPSCLISLSARYYRDTGEIENSLFSNAAPGIKSYQAGLGLRYLWEHSAFKIYVAPYFTRYEPFGLSTAFFQNLYRNRDWGIAQIAYSFSF
ncbi:MAG: hypothetical protein HY735_16435 [Verrucomicrobia bacterium]|nr:hypothetical protein [Verrucomicrobiota bacterium]